LLAGHRAARETLDGAAGPPGSRTPVAGGGEESVSLDLN
jgi:hypothetical protein